MVNSIKNEAFGKLRNGLTFRFRANDNIRKNKVAKVMHKFKPVLAPTNEELRNFREKVGGRVPRRRNTTNNIILRPIEHTEPSIVIRRDETRTSSQKKKKKR